MQGMDLDLDLELELDVDPDHEFEIPIEVQLRFLLRSWMRRVNKLRVRQRFVEFLQMMLDDWDENLIVGY